MKRGVLYFVLFVLLVGSVSAVFVDDGLDSKFVNDGKVRVIVKLKDPVQKGFSVKSSFKSNQNKVLNNLDDFKAKHKYTTINGFSGSLSKSDFNKLKNDPDVEGIFIDQSMSVNLHQAISLTGSDVVSSFQLNSFNLTGLGQTVCVVDTGISYSHASFGGCSITNFSLSGSNESYVLESSHNYSDSFDYTWTVNMSGYSQISVHFVNISLEYQREVGGANTGDRVTLYDSDYNFIASYHGINGVIEDFWSPYSNGDTLYLRLESDGSFTDYGFYIDQVRNGSSDTSYDWSSCNKVIGGWDFVNNDGDPMDDNGHGSHVAGIVASNNSSYRGVAPDAKLVAAKVLDSAGDGWSSDIIAGIDFCTNLSDSLNISVISMSLGCSGGGCVHYQSFCNSDPLASVVDAAVARNITVPIAAGNSAWTDGISTPSCIESSLPVTSSTKSDTMSSFSNRGTIVSIIAPGGTTAGSAACPADNYICSVDDGGGFIGYSGTSMAVPMVSGAVALLNQFLLEWNSSVYSPSQIETLINQTGIAIFDSGTSKNYYRLDVENLILSQDTSSPVVSFVVPVNDSLINDSLILINVSVNDSLNIDSCLLEWNGVNESMIKEGSGSFVFCSVNKSKSLGVFSFRVFANDSFSNIGVSELRQITIGNTLPFLSDVFVNSSDSLNMSNSSLIGNFTFADVDGDSLVDYESMWFNGSVEISGLRNLSQITSGNTSKCQVWIFSTRVFDGFNWSVWHNSSGLVIENSPPILSSFESVSINETELVNISVNASDFDNDNLTYGINDSRFVSTDNYFTWQSNLSDSGTYVVRINVTDGTDLDYQDVTITVFDAADFDGDGNPDFNDTDDDNDGLNDSVDFLTGNVSDINGSVNLFINSSENTSQEFIGVLLVNVTDESNNSLVSFNWNFSLTSLFINFSVDYNSSAGTLRVQNLDFSRQSVTKTVYFNKSDSSFNYVCFADDDSTSVAGLGSDCSGGTSLVCPGSSGSYSCSVEGDYFVLSGLSNSVVRGIYVAPVVVGGSGGGGGSSSTASTIVCDPFWSCTDWSECIDGFQTRICEDLNSCDNLTDMPGWDLRCSSGSSGGGSYVEPVVEVPVQEVEEVVPDKLDQSITMAASAEDPEKRLSSFFVEKNEFVVIVLAIFLVCLFSYFYLWRHKSKQR